MLYKYFCYSVSPQEKHPALAELLELSRGRLQPTPAFEGDLQRRLRDPVALMPPALRSFGKSNGCLWHRIIIHKGLKPISS